MESVDQHWGLRPEDQSNSGVTSSSSCPPCRTGLDETSGVAALVRARGAVKGTSIWLVCVHTWQCWHSTSICSTLIRIILVAFLKFLIHTLGALKAILSIRPHDIHEAHYHCFTPQYSTWNVAGGYLRQLRGMLASVWSPNSGWAGHYGETRRHFRVRLLYSVRNFGTHPSRLRHAS